jgi:hypothetical protein
MRRVVYGDPYAFGRWLGDRLLAVGCSGAYVEAFKLDLWRRIESGEIEVRQRA